MENPSSSRADAAFERALAAYQEKSYEVARRWAMEALAHNSQHAAARALLARLDAARSASNPYQSSSGSEVVSTDPTVLISRASASPSRTPPKTEPIDPTVAIARADMRRRTVDTDTRPIPKQPAPDRPGAEPTIIAQPRPRASSSTTTSPSSRDRRAGFSLGAALQSLGERLQSSGTKRSTASGKSTSSSTLAKPATQGAIIAIATVAVGALAVIAAIFLFRWAFPGGQQLTITKPTGGTIVGPGIECGTRGNQCSASVATGQPIELETRPDKDYVFSGFTGDCAPAGRTAMTQGRTCGATFDRVEVAVPVATFRLTITKPEGGTIVGAGGILCGVDGSTCTADIPSGMPVTLKAAAAEGFAWEQFTGDCPSTGEMTMTRAMTCGATFVRSSAPINVGPPVNRPPVTRPKPVAPPPPIVATPPPVTQAPPPQTSGQPATSGQTPTPSTSSSAPSDPAKPPPPPISAEEHAKQEIGQLVKNYCTALTTLNPANVRKLFHLDNTRELRDKFKEYKSLKCTIQGQPEYDRLDAREAGGAQVRFDMKQVPEMRSGGAPKAMDLAVTMVVSRRDFQSPWLIDRVSIEQKPK